MDAKTVALLNAAAPRAKALCEKCSGAGWFYQPALSQQDREIRDGKRKFTSSRVCTCIKGQT